MVRGKKHRLSREYYRGQRAVAFTLCLQDQQSGFSDSSVVHACQTILEDIILKSDCIVPAYCFMPDHQHLLLVGKSECSDVLKTLIVYKQKTGYWMSQVASGVRWQKSFFDHIIRTEDSIVKHVRYIIENPVRRGIVNQWDAYPFLGAIGCDLTHRLSS